MSSEKSELKEDPLKDVVEALKTLLKREAYRIRVGRGRTIRPGDQEEWIKEYYELEMAVTDPAELPLARAHMLGTIDAWLSETIKAETVKAAIPQLDLADLEDLFWTKYKSQDKAERGDAGWTKNPEFFADALEEPARSLAVRLAKAVRDAGGKLELGEYVFSLSGENDRFIGRRPTKQK